MIQRIGLIGDPVAHSRSPAMQNAALMHLGIPASYELWHTPADALPARIAMLRTSECLGANVTLPHKTAVLPLLDDLEQIAARIGAVNTIYKRADGALVGTNTDAPALLTTLREDGQFEPGGQRVVLLGASGAARAAAYALVAAQVERLVVVNRTLERAEELLADVTLSQLDPRNYQETAPLPQLIALALDDPDVPAYLADSTLLINATAVGWQAEATPLPTLTVAPGMLVYDMVYRPTRLLREAAAQGARTLDGLGMLLHQGTLAFTHWTGQPAPLAVMRSALQAA